MSVDNGFVSNNPGLILAAVQIGPQLKSCTPSAGQRDVLENTVSGLDFYRSAKPGKEQLSTLDFEVLPAITSSFGPSSIHQHLSDVYDAGAKVPYVYIMDRLSAASTANLSLSGECILNQWAKFPVGNLGELQMHPGQLTLIGAPAIITS